MVMTAILQFQDKNAVPSSSWDLSKTNFASLGMTSVSVSDSKVKPCLVSVSFRTCTSMSKKSGYNYYGIRRTKWSHTFKFQMVEASHRFPIDTRSTLKSNIENCESSFT